MTELSPTYGSFSIKGIVVGLLSDRFYNEGEREGGSSWRRLSFGVKVSNSSFVYVELMGSKSTKIKVYYRRDGKKEFDFINWNDLDRLPQNYKIHMPVKLCFKQSESDEYVPYEAVEHIRETLRDGDSVYINGSLQYHEYQGKVQERFNIQEIGRLSEVLDIYDFKEQEAFFTQEIVFTSLNKDSNYKKYIVNAILLSKKDNELHRLPYTYVIDYGKYSEENGLDEIKEVIRMFKEDITYGSTVRVFGNINHHVDTIEIDGQTVVTGSAIREFEITGGSLRSIVRGRYSEQELTFVERSDPFTYVDEEALKSESEWAF